MNNIRRSAVAIILLVAIVASIFVPVNVSAAGEPTKYSTASNSGTRDVVATSLNGTSAANYYTGSYTYDSLSDLSSSNLKTQLKKLMTDTHKYKSSYNDCHYKADLTDCENNNGKVTLIYTGYQATMEQWNGWNREHVWPQSLGGGNTSGGGADLHHIRPSDAGVNSSRGNKKYGNVDGGTAKYGSNPATGYLGGTYNNTYFEPNDNVKGDVARICLYVWIRWGSSWGADNVTEVFQSVDVLLEWCKLDPVDTWELGRNEVIGKIQGNRNVFIDYPELAWLVFDKEIPSDMKTPSGKAQGGSGSGGSGSTDTPDTPACQHTSTEIRGKIDATCGKKGYTGDTYCKSCGEKIKTGSATSATGNHTWGEAVVTTPPTETEAGQAKQTCTGCGAYKYITLPATGDGSCTHTEIELRGAKDATEDAAGYTGDTYCKGCGILIEEGSVIPKLEADDPVTPPADDPVTPDVPAVNADKLGELVGALEDRERIILLIYLGVLDSTMLDLIESSLN